MENQYNKVDKVEFERFLVEYPNRLEIRTTFSEPPIRHCLDATIPSTHSRGTKEYLFTKEIGKIVMNVLGPDGEMDTDCTACYWEYYIRIMDPK